MASGSGITFKETAPGDIATPTTDKQTLFVDNALSPPALALKDDTGTVTPVSSGTVTHSTGALTASAVIVGNGAGDIKALASLGTTTTLLHGNAAGLPTFGAVALAADVSGDLPFANFVQATAASKLVGRGSASGAGDFEEISLGASLSMSATTLSLAANQAIAGIAFIIDGNGSAITTGVKGFLQIPFACTISSWTILSTDAAATSGSIVIDIWKDVLANYPPTIADTITASAKPTLTTATNATSSTLTGWTTSVTAGDVLGFNVDSITTVTRITIQLKVSKT